MKRYRTDSEHHGMEESKDGEFISLNELIIKLEEILGCSKKFPEEVGCDLDEFILELKER